MNPQTLNTLTYSVTDGVAFITFNRPDQLNAMNRMMMQELIESIQYLNIDPDARVGVLTGNGKAFMAGADIKEYARQTDAEFVSFQNLGRQLYAAIEGNTKPVIAAVNGYAFGGGFEIALACDMIVAVEGAKMGLPEILLNLIPGGGGTQRLPRKIGANLAAEWLMTGCTLNAEELKAQGLVNHIYAKESFLEETRTFATEVAGKSPEALAILKQLVQLASGPANPAHQAIENDALARFYRSPEGQERIQHFLRKSEEKAKSSKK